MSKPALVTAAEISRLAGVTRATVSNWRRRHSDFPAPTGGTDSSPAYDLEAVRNWLAHRDQLPAEQATDDFRSTLWMTSQGHPALGRFLALALAAARLDAAGLKSMIESTDDTLRQRARTLAQGYANVVPGAADLDFDAADAQLLRSLLRYVEVDGGLDAVEVLASRLTMDSSPHQTPGALVDLMADLLARPSEPYPSSVFDPACGVGNLLAAAAHRGSTQLLGQEINEGAAAVAVARLSLSSPAARVQVETGDSMRADAFVDERAQGALCNPPYGIRDWGHEDVAYDPRWAYGLPPKGESELAWVQHCLAHVEPGGLAICLMPPATSERASGRRIRAELVRSGALQAVIALPAGAAAPLHVGLQVWVLKRPGDENPSQVVLFVDLANSDPAERAQIKVLKRPETDWTMLFQPALSSWTAFRADPEGFETTPGHARAVPVTTLLDETVDLTPARHVRTAPLTTQPHEYARTANALRTRLRQVLTELEHRGDGKQWPAAGDDLRSWRTATVGDLVRGGAVTLTRSGSTNRDGKYKEVVVSAGDVILPELLRKDAMRARVADQDDEGQRLDPHFILLRPDPERLDPWFLAGFLTAQDNLNAAATGASIIRIDPGRLRVPLLPLDEQHRYGTAFRELHGLRSSADRIARLATETAEALGSGLTGGALLPPEPEPGSD